MQYTVEIQVWDHRRDPQTYSYECRVKFSVIDTALIGTPRQCESYHYIKISMTDILMDAWDLPGAMAFKAATINMVKVALQYLEEHLRAELQLGIPPDEVLEPLNLTIKNSPETCPFKIDNIDYPEKKSFIVDVPQKDGFITHPNIQILMNRMDDALEREDYSGVLHSSASIFETMAKDIVGISTVQDQSLKGFFERYRKESLLPDGILEYILAVYDSRNVTPLAGHGSTSFPNTTEEEALTLCEMTKALVKIEYRLRKNKT